MRSAISNLQHPERNGSSSIGRASRRSDALQDRRRPIAFCSIYRGAYIEQPGLLPAWICGKFSPGICGVCAMRRACRRTTSHMKRRSAPFPAPAMRSCRGSPLAPPHRELARRRRHAGIRRGPSRQDTGHGPSDQPLPARCARGCGRAPLRRKQLRSSGTALISRWAMSPPRSSRWSLTPRV